MCLLKAVWTYCLSSQQRVCVCVCVCPEGGDSPLRAISTTVGGIEFLLFHHLKKTYSAPVYSSIQITLFKVLLVLCTHSCPGWEQRGWRHVSSPTPLPDGMSSQWGLSPPPPTKHTHAHTQTHTDTISPLDMWKDYKQTEAVWVYVWVCVCVWGYRAEELLHVDCALWCLCHITSLLLLLLKKEKKKRGNSLKWPPVAPHKQPSERCQHLPH